MSDTQKFAADIQRAKKRNRNGDALDKNSALRDIESLFVRQNPQCKGLAQSLFDWWKNELFPGRELDDVSLEKLCALNAFLNDEEDTDILDAGDWRRLKDEVGYEGENIPLELLSAMMKTIVSKGGLD